ncbi:MAG TPA: phosphate propanoyltransferase [Anaerolineae bacterium]|nr:phosphate propanoyltransferase [Anaerolineae bacterium]
MNSPEINQPTPVDQEILDRIVREVFERMSLQGPETVPTGEIVSKEHGVSIHPKKIPIGVSVRHVHLSNKDLQTLYGTGAVPHPVKELYQPGTYAAQETVGLIGPKMRLLERVRILGPLRDRTQVELAKTDAIFLGVDAPFRLSGDIKGSAPITIIGPQGVLQLNEGCIRAMRHIHMNQKEAEYFGLKDGDLVKLRVGGPTAVTFENVVIRIGENIRLEVHLDTDEGNVADIHCNQEVEIIKNGLIKGSVS